jgi:hypothetical protein
VATLNSLDDRIKSNAAISPAGAGGAISVFGANNTDVILDINGHFVPANTAGSLAFYPVTPCRSVDTRNGTLINGAFIAGQARTLPILSSSCNVPSTATLLHRQQPGCRSTTCRPVAFGYKTAGRFLAFTGQIDINVFASGCGATPGVQAYVLNATVVPQPTLGFLTMWPQGISRPTVATLNALDGAITNNLAIVPSSDIAISAVASDQTHLILDLFGYFGP